MKQMTETKSARAEFAEKIGMISQGEGLPRIAGRVFGLLVFDGEALAFGELAERLQVSRGSVSSSVRLLEERGLIRRIARPGERQDFFQPARAPYATMVEGARKRTSAARDEIGMTIAELPASADGVRTRLRDYADFYRSIDDALGANRHRHSKSGGRQQPRERTP